MAAPPQGRPGRTLGILALLILALAAWTFWPGQTHTPKLGLDLRGGTQVILTPTVTSGDGVITQEQLDQTVSIIRQRVDGIGVAESEVTTQGTGSGASIVVSIPGQTTDQIINSLKSTAKLDFRPVLAEAAGGTAPTRSPSPTTSPTPSPTPTPSKSAGTTASPKPSSSAKSSAFKRGGTYSVTPAVYGGGATVVRTATTPSPTPKPVATPATTSGTTPSPSPTAKPATDALLPPIQSKTDDALFQAKYAALNCLAPGALTGGKPVDATNFLATCEAKTGSAKYRLAPATVLGVQISGASASPPQSGIGGWSVNLSFNSAGKQAFLDTTTKLSKNQQPQNQFGIVLDGFVVSAPSVSGPIAGDAQITGNFTQAEATSLANVLKYGALPVSLTVASIEQIGPQLGQDQLNAGLIAGALGLLLVVLYLLAYYRALGVVAVASLLVAAGITYGLFVVLGRQLGLALSLAGVAGAIVAIGITADSFIVYFERIRDEIRDGRSLRTAVDTGWVRARRTILAADFVSFLAASLLYFISVGSVRGFAFTLGLTTIVDVAVAFAFTRPVLSLLARTRWFTSGHPMTGLDPRRLGISDHSSTLRAPVARTRTNATAGRKES